VKREAEAARDVDEGANGDMRGAGGDAEATHGAGRGIGAVRDAG
jgi:hypothetical protein